MPKVRETAKDFVFWHKRFLDVAGLWPLEARGIKFYAFIAYCTVHLCASVADFSLVFGQFDLMVANFSELSLLVMVMTKIPALRYSSLLRNVVTEIVASDGDNEDNFKNETERQIYSTYSAHCLRLFQLALRIGWVACCAFYIKALVYFFIGEMFGAGPTVYLMPYRVNFFINITNIRVYILVYAYQGPMIYVFICHGLIACFMWSLIIDVCGQLSVLAFRIKNMRVTRSEKSNEQLEYAFRRIIQKHNKIIQTFQALESIYKIFLLDEVVICTVIVGFWLYIVFVMGTNLEDALAFVCFIMCISAVLLATFGWCLVGDFLKHESLNILDAYYECEWYDMPPRFQKLIIICMIRARSPLCISGGGFYIYTLTSFTGVIKSATAYASMLRQIN